MRRDALAAAHRIVNNLDTPDYATIRAAALLLGQDKPAPVDQPQRDDDAPAPTVILHDNGRSAGVRYGRHAEDQRVIVMPAGFALEDRPESDYAHVPKPAGVTADREASKAWVEN